MIAGSPYGYRRVKLPAHRLGLPGKVLSFILCPLTTAYKAGLAGHVPAKEWMLPLSFLIFAMIMILLEKAQ